MPKTLMILLLHPLLCSFTCIRGDRFFSTDDIGVATVASTNASGGGIGSLLPTGNGRSNGARSTWRQIAQQPSSISVTDSGIVMTNIVIDRSTTVGERGFIANTIARATAFRDIALGGFRFAGRRVDAEQATEQIRSNNRTRATIMAPR